MQTSKDTPCNIHMKNRNFQFAFEAETSFNHACYSLIYGYEFKWGEEDSAIINEFLKAKNLSSAAKYTQIIKRQLLRP